MIETGSKHIGILAKLLGMNAKRKESGKKREAKIVLVDGLIGTVRAN